MQFGIRTFSEKEINQVIEYTKTFSALSRHELAYTICENLNWKTPTGELKINSALAMLQKLEDLGRVKLKPLKARVHVKRNQSQKELTGDTSEHECIEGSVENYHVFLKEVVEPSDHNHWDKMIDEYHYLGYKKLFGLSLKYFICIEGMPEPVGCISFTCSTTFRQKDRDNWIGWSDDQRIKGLNKVLNNNRMLIFPWITIKNLGSKSISIALSQISNDWTRRFNYTPQLVETYVDPSRFSGSIYKASNFTCIGYTSGNYWVKGEVVPKDQQIKKEIYMYTLNSHYKSVLCNTVTVVEEKKTAPQSNPEKCMKRFESHLKELDVWEKIQYEFALICQRLDADTFKQSRQVNALTMILAIYRIVFANNFKSYDSILCDLIDNSNAHGIKLSFTESLLPATFCIARQKLDANIFTEINTKAIAIYEAHITKPEDYLWFDRRVFAVDGSKINLPRETQAKENGNYRLPCHKAFYPQGLMSCLYRLKTKMAYDVTFTNSMDEQGEAVKHLKTLKPGDVVIYDRGYISYHLLYWHKRLNIDAVFRLKKQSFKDIDSFIKEDDEDKIISISPSIGTFNNIKKKHPEIRELESFPLRLMKYKIGNETYYLGSSILDKNITINDYIEAYHARWGHEELYKTLKVHLETIEFHGKNEDFIKQELFAAMGILTFNRILTNYTEEDLNNNFDCFERPIKVNVKGQLDNLLKFVEPILVKDSVDLNSLLQKNRERAIRSSYKVRNGRKSIRKSHRRINKWQKQVK